MLLSNSSHWTNIDRAAWFLTRPETIHLPYWLDLVGGRQALITALEGRGWSTTPRTGGFACLDLDGASGSYATLATPAANPTGAFTLAFWYRAAMPPRALSYVLGITGGGVFAGNTYADADLAINSVGYYDGTLKFSTVADTFTTASIDAWRFVTVSFDPAAAPRARIWLDGIAQPIFMEPTAVAPAPWAPMGFLYRPDAPSLSAAGEIDSVSHWHRGFSAAEGPALYAEELAGNINALATGQPTTPAPTRRFLPRRPPKRRRASRR